MTEATAPKKTAKLRTKPEGARPHVVTVAGKEWLMTFENVRVAAAPDLMRALDGSLPTADLVGKASKMPAFGG